MNEPALRHETAYPPSAPPTQDLLATLFLRMRTIVLVFLGVVGFAAFAVFYLLTPAYEASSTLVINSKDLILPVVEGVPASEFEKQSAFLSQKDVLLSAQIAEQVIDRLELDQRRVLSRIEKAKIGVRDYKRKLGKYLDIEGWQQPEDYRARALAALAAGLAVEGKPDNQAIKLSYVANHPAEAADTLNAVVDVYQAYFYGQLKDRALGLTTYLESQLADVNLQLAQTEKEMLRFRRADRITLSSSRESGEFGESGGSAGGSSSSQTDLLGITGSPEVQNDIKLRVLSMQDELRRLRTEFGERAPRVIELREKIRSYTSAIDKVPEREVDLIRLRRNLEINQDAAINLRRNLEKAKTVLAADTRAINVITVLDRAEPDGRPISPKRQLAMVAAVIFGLAFGLIMALIRHYFDHSLRTPRDLEAYLGVKLLGSLQVLR